MDPITQPDTRLCLACCAAMVTGRSLPYVLNRARISKSDNGKPCMEVRSFRSYVSSEGFYYREIHGVPEHTWFVWCESFVYFSMTGENAFYHAIASDGLDQFDPIAGQSKFKKSFLGPSSLSIFLKREPPFCFPEYFED